MCSVHVRVRDGIASGITLHIGLKDHQIVPVLSGGQVLSDNGHGLRLCVRTQLGVTNVQRWSVQVRVVSGGGQASGYLAHDLSAALQAACCFRGRRNRGLRMTGLFTRFIQDILRFVVKTDSRRVTVDVPITGRNDMGNKRTGSNFELPVSLIEAVHVEDGDGVVAFLRRTR